MPNIFDSVYAPVPINGKAARGGSMSRDVHRDEQSLSLPELCAMRERLESQRAVFSKRAGIRSKSQRKNLTSRINRGGEEYIKKLSPEVRQWYEHGQALFRLQTIINQLKETA